MLHASWTLNIAGKTRHFNLVIQLNVVELGMFELLAIYSIFSICGTLQPTIDGTDRLQLLYIYTVFNNNGLHILSSND